MSKNVIIIAEVNKAKEEFEDTKGVIRIRKSKKDKQHNDEMKKDKQLSTKHTHKTISVYY